MTDDLASESRQTRDGKVTAYEHDNTHYFGDGCPEVHGRVVCDFSDAPHRLNEGGECRNPRPVYEETRPAPTRGVVVVTAEQRELALDILSVLTVYDEHVAPDDRGIWRHRLERFAREVLSRCRACGYPVNDGW